MYRGRLVQLSRGFSSANSGPSQAGASNGAGHEKATPPPATERLNEETEEQLKERVYEASLQYIPRYGWSRRSIAAGAKSIGLPGVAHGLFPNGAPDLITHFYLSCNADLVEQMIEQKTAEAEGRVEKKGTTKFIRDSIEARLRLNAPYIDTWSQAMGIMAMPNNAMRAWANLSSLVDDMWHHAGDKSVDMSWYSKRVTLGAVYKATEIYMVQDESDDFEYTWEFLDKRLKDMGTIGKSVRQIQKASSNMGDNLWTLSQLTRNVMGMNDRHR